MKNQLPILSKNSDMRSLYEKSPVKDYLSHSNKPVIRWLGDALAIVWQEHEHRLSCTNIVKAIEGKRITRSAYMNYLKNMRQQVIEGSRWISLAASSMDEEHSVLRFALIEHAKTEHKDYKMLENDYLAMGGNEKDILNQEKNIGTMALDAYISYQAQRPNPVHAFGASFIIEGMGSCKAGPWSEFIQKSIDCPDNAVSFLKYHGKADIAHNQNLVKILSSPFITESVARGIYNCARVVSQLYALQLSEIESH